VLIQKSTNLFLTEHK